MVASWHLPDEVLHGLTVLLKTGEQSGDFAVFIQKVFSPRKKQNKTLSAGLLACIKNVSDALSVLLGLK